jgi:hypothetical protein
LKWRKKVKSKIPAVLTLFVFSVVPALAQTTPSNATNVANLPDWFIVGHGTAGNIPLFVAPFKLADSALFQSQNGYLGLGTVTPVSTFNVVNNETSNNQFNLQPYGIYATLNNSTVNFSAAVRGDSLATTGGTAGVIGLANSPGGAGVRGVSIEPSGGGYGVIGSLSAIPGGGGGGGVLGQTQSTTGFTSAVRGDAQGTSGGSVAIYGEQFSPEATAGLFINRASGNILVGSVSSPDITVFRVDGTGRVFADGGFQPSGADFAESMAVAGNRNSYVPGDLLVIDSNASRRLSLADQPYSTLVAGIYSTKPGMLGSTRKLDEAAAVDEVPLAVVGIVPCKVIAENGAIAVGDLLVTSSAPGYAMKGTDRQRMLGAVVGKALEPLPKGTGMIQVLVTLQLGTLNAERASSLSWQIRSIPEQEQRTMCQLEI